MYLKNHIVCVCMCARARVWIGLEDSLIEFPRQTLYLLLNYYYLTTLIADSHISIVYRYESIYL